METHLKGILLGSQLPDKERKMWGSVIKSMNVLLYL